MDLLLDTTIQVDRITGSARRKEAIETVTKGNKLYCSTYVLGEYYDNIVTDFVTLYNLFMMNKSVAETGKLINEQVFGRSRDRVYKLFFNIVELCENDLEEIEDAFLTYTDLIQDGFYNGLEDELLNSINCPRAEREITFEDDMPVLSKVSCRKDNEICNVCEFWENASVEREQIVASNDVGINIVDILNAAKNDESRYRGNNCKTLGDTVISLEACKDEKDLTVCSSNAKDFQPICDAIGVKLVSPDYSWKDK